MLHLTALASSKISQFKPTFFPNRINLKRNKPEFTLRRNCRWKGKPRWLFWEPTKLPRSNLHRRLAGFPPVGAVRQRTRRHSYFLFAPDTSQHAASAAQAGICPLSPAIQRDERTPSPGFLFGQPLSGSGMLREDEPGRARIPPRRPPHLSQPPPAPQPQRRGGGGPVLTVQQAPRHLPPHGRAARRGHGRLPLRASSPRPTREPAAPRRQPPPTPAPPAAAPALGAVMFIYIRRRRLRGFLK